MAILDRPRHEKLIGEVRKAGARISLIADGEVSPALATTVCGERHRSAMGVGSASAALLTAAGLSCAGGDAAGALLPSNAEEASSLPRQGSRTRQKYVARAISFRAA